MDYEKYIYSLMQTKIDTLYCDWQNGDITQEELHEMLEQLREETIASVESMRSDDS